LKKIEAAYFLWQASKQMFAISIRDGQTGRREDLCDIHVEHPISVEKVQDIVNICNQQVIEPIRTRGAMYIVDILRAIADVIVLEKGSIEVDLNLYYGGNAFADGMADARLLFVRGGNVFEWNNEVDAVNALHSFLSGCTF